MFLVGSVRSLYITLDPYGGAVLGAAFGSFLLSIQYFDNNGQHYQIASFAAPRRGRYSSDMKLLLALLLCVTAWSTNCDVTAYGAKGDALTVVIQRLEPIDPTPHPAQQEAFAESRRPE